MSDAQHPARIAYEGHLGGRGATLLLLGIAALVAGVLVITRHHHPRPYSMSSDTRPRLPDGRVASATGMSVADAIGRQPARLVAVHGYLEAAADDRPYLCARLNGFTGTVSLTSTDSAASFDLTPYTFTTGSGADNGAHTFSGILQTAGTRSIRSTTRPCA